MDEQIENIRLKFSYDADWDSMEYVDGIKHCIHCQKKVYDFTDAKPNEFLKILAENNNNVCGRFKQEQMTTSHIVLPAWKKWVSAALVLIGINVFNNETQAQALKTKTVSQDSTKKDLTGITGFFLQVEPHPHGGLKVFQEFLSNNLHYTPKMKSGKVFATFTVNKDGSVTDIRIVRGLSKLNDDEVTRVLKLSPKWTPGVENGKPVAVAFTIPVNFAKK